MSDDIPTLRTVKQFCEEHPEFTQGGVRWLIFNESRNGLKQSGAIVRIGRRVYIDIDKFFAWVKLIQDQAEAA